MKCVDFLLFLSYFLLFPSIYAQNRTLTNQEFTYFFLYKSAKNFSLLPYSTPNFGIEIENKYLLQETFYSKLRSHFRYKQSHFICQFSYFGLPEYGEVCTSFGYSHLLFSKLSFNITFHYLIHYAQNYRATHSLSFDASIAYFLNQKWLLTFKVENPACLKYGIIGDFFIPTRFCMEHHFLFMRNGAFTISAEQTIKGKFNAGIGFVYQIKKLGFSLNTTLLYSSLNCTWQYKTWNFSLENLFNYQLGYSPKISIFYHFSKN